MSVDVSTATINVRKSSNFIGSILPCRTSQIKGREPGPSDPCSVPGTTGSGAAGPLAGESLSTGPCHSGVDRLGKRNRTDPCLLYTSYGELRGQLRRVPSFSFISQGGNVSAQTDFVQLGHGSGGQMMKRIIDEVFLEAFGSPELLAGNDAGVADLPASSDRIAMSTDSFVVTPQFLSLIHILIAKFAASTVF